MANTVTELLKKVRRLEIVSNRFANDLFAGQYKSAFRGRGMEFSEVREYQPGDDIRQIDWNVTARAGRPYVKRFVEEREQTVMFMVDVSASGMFGVKQSKMETAIEIAATLMFSALKNNDRVGLLTFCDQVLDYFPPRKGKANVLHLIRELVGYEPVVQPTNMNTAIEYVNRVLKKRAVIFLLSDFLTPELNDAIAQCRRKHDLIALNMTDSYDTEFPNVGFVSLMDPESGEIIEVDTSSRRTRKQLAFLLQNNQQNVENQLKRKKIDQLKITDDQDFVNELRHFFRKRAKNFR